MRDYVENRLSKFVSSCLAILYERLIDCVALGKSRQEIVLGANLRVATLVEALLAADEL